MEKRKRRQADEKRTPSRPRSTRKEDKATGGERIVPVHRMSDARAGACEVLSPRCLWRHGTHTLATASLVRKAVLTENERRKGISPAPIQRFSARCYILKVVSAFTGSSLTGPASRVATHV